MSQFAYMYVQNCEINNYTSLIAISVEPNSEVFVVVVRVDDDRNQRSLTGISKINRLEYRGKAAYAQLTLLPLRWRWGMYVGTHLETHTSIRIASFSAILCH